MSSRKQSRSSGNSRVLVEPKYSRDGEQFAAGYVPRNPVLRSAAAFPRDAHAQFAIDRVTVTCYLKRPWHGRAPRVTPQAYEELRAAKALSRRGRRLIAVLGHGLEVALGGEPGGDGFTTGHVVGNVMRRVRRRLIDEGRYPRQKAPRARGDNFVDPARLADGVDLHAECLAELALIIRDARKAYAEAVRRLFGLDVRPDEVRASLTQIELNWDVNSKVARAVSSIWWRPWRDAVVGACIGVGDDHEGYERMRPRRTEATEHREPDAIIGAGVLRADAAIGGGYKLDAKDDHLLRFEAEFTAARAEKILGRRIRVDNLDQMTADLERLGRQAYETVLRAQGNLVCEWIFSIAELITAFHTPTEARKLQPLVEAFEAGDKFHHTGRSCERLLAVCDVRGWCGTLGAGSGRRSSG